MRQGLQRTTHIISITIESHDDSHRVVRVFFVNPTHLIRHDIRLVHIRISLNKLQIANLFFSLVLRRWQQVMSDAQLLFTILIKDIQ